MNLPNRLLRFPEELDVVHLADVPEPQFYQSLGLLNGACDLADELIGFVLE